MTAADAGSCRPTTRSRARTGGQGFRLSAADSLSLGNALCGFLAVCVLASSAIQALKAGDGFLPDPRYFATAVVLLLIGATCDLFDGLVARRFRASAWAPSSTTWPM
ncbi:CDP-alcohol phosphatidyltransferase family protein [Nonomuraea dietziae]|uniref:CDP-alcohol phosphatidyltransferase family protein n=1 Tax=Nonomuraea dietziae TaxID=65515 RepID=UPI0031D854A9